MIPNLAQLPERARMSGDRPALFVAGRVIDYRELASRVNETERGLGALGVGSGDVVAVLLTNGLAFAEILHAIAQRGAVLLPLNARLTPRELAFQLEESGARLLIHGTLHVLGHDHERDGEARAMRVEERRLWCEIRS